MPITAVLSFIASAGDFTGAFSFVHVARLAADVSFIRFDLASELRAGSHAQRETDSVIHEPRGFLRDADSAVNFVGTDAVLAVHDLPHR